MDNDNPLGLTDVVFDDIAPPPADPDAVARKKWQLEARGGHFAIDPALCDVWAGNTRDVAALASPAFADLMESLQKVGQQVPAIARISPGDPDRLEIVAGACRLTAIRRINEERGVHEQMRLLVDLRDLDDEAALKIVDAENRGRSDMSQFEKACFYERAIPGIYATEQNLAAALGLNKSTVNRTLAIARLPGEVVALVEDRHAISAAQASAFLSDWNRPELLETLNDTIVDLSAKGQASAAVVFKALREAVAPPGALGAVTIVHEGADLGSVRRKASGAVVIELRPAAGPLGWKSVAQATGQALKQLGTPGER